MKSETSHNTLRSSILLEMHGELLYRQAAQSAADPEVKAFFEKMADDERVHAEILRERFKSYQEGTKFDYTTNTRYTTNKVEQIRNPMLVQMIECSSFSAAAISAAILMEEKSVKEYLQMASNASDPDEIKLYKWLSEWEQEHVERLTVLRDGLRVKSLTTETI